jgi:co-chaperonin GroES (HSP10)
MIKPLGAKVLLKEVSNTSESKTESGIIIALNNQKVNETILAEIKGHTTRAYDIAQELDMGGLIYESKVYVKREDVDIVTDTNGEEYLLVDVDKILCLVK